MPRDLRNRRVTVMGLGAFGGGEGVVRYLVERGARVTLTDLKSEQDLAATLARLDDCRPACLKLGGHDEDDFRTADLVVVNPAVPRSNRYVTLARSSGIELTSEMNLFVEEVRARVVAVTGSIGKSTTTALLESMLSRAGHRTWLGGNIGRSLLEFLPLIQPEDLVVLELSSFQLADLDRIRFRPEVAVVTNLKPNHLDWHGDLADYRRCKQSILRWQTDSDVAVLNADDKDVRDWPTAARRVMFGEASTADLRIEQGWLLHESFQIDLRTGFPLPGRHHAMNAAAASLAALQLGATESAIRTALSEFTGLPHRMQPLGEWAGRRCFDDSKATTVEAAIAALEAFDQPVVLLAGGYNKQVDLAPLAESIRLHARHVILMGQTAGALKELLEAGSPVPALTVATSFDHAMEAAYAQSQPGDVVLLSPGCASYGWFNNYVERGEAFARAVRQW